MRSSTPPSWANAKIGAVRRSYRYRLYPTRKQAAALEHQLGQACDLYNAALEHRRTMWRDYGRAVSYVDQAAEVKLLRAGGLLDSSSNAWSQMEPLPEKSRVPRCVTLLRTT
jgi:transposase